MIRFRSFKFARSFTRHLPVLAGLTLAAVLPTTVHAAVNVGNVQIGGFFSQGYLESTNNNYPVETKDGTTDFREMGFNASTTIGSRLRVGGQLFAQTFGKYGNDKVILDWAMVDYNILPEIGLRVGRLKYPRSLHSDVLDLDMVRPFILLPQALYDTRLRDFQSSFDGGMIYGTLTAGQSAFDYKVFYGDIPIKTDSGAADYFNNAGVFSNPPGVKNIGLDSVRGISLLWNTPLVGLRIGASYSYLTNVVASGPFQAVPAFSASVTLIKYEYDGVSVEYTKNAWTFTGEYLLIKGRTLLTLPAFIAPPARKSYSTRNFYVSVARRLGPKFEAGAYYAETRTGYPIDGSTASSNRRQDWTLALRYDFNDHLLFKIEGHAIHGTQEMFNVPGISNPPAGLKDSMGLFAAKTTLSF